MGEGLTSWLVVVEDEVDGSRYLRRVKTWPAINGTAPIALHK
jgi:hypothetical protein